MYVRQRAAHRAALTCVFILIPILPSVAFPQVDPEPSAFDGYMLGAAVRHMSVDAFILADVPLIEARLPVSNEALQFRYGGQLIWGVSAFFVEWYYGAGLLVYPLNDIVGISTSLRLGSFLLDNISVIGSVGIMIDIPIGRYEVASLEVEYFYRQSEDLFDFVSFPAYGSRGDEAITIDAGGVGIGVTFRL